MLRKEPLLVSFLVVIAKFRTKRDQDIEDLKRLVAECGKKSIIVRSNILLGLIKNTP